MKRILAVLSLFGASLSVRVAFWIIGFASYLNWIIYDVGLYVDSGRDLITSIFNGSNEIVNSLIFHPLLGIYTAGLSSISLSSFLDRYSAGLLSPILFSSLTCLVVFLIGEKIGGFRVGFTAWLLASFDPYSLQFSTTFLDMPATFFSTLLMYFLVRYDHSIDLKRSTFLGIIAGLAASSKHVVTPLVGLLLILYIKDIRNLLSTFFSTTISYLLVNIVKFTSLEQIRLMLLSNVGGGGLGIPAIIYGPIEIGKPYTYPWYILTYLGLGYTGIGTAPYVIPVITFTLFCYLKTSKNTIFSTAQYSKLIQWTASSLIPLAFLPRNYWIPLNRFPGISGESDVLTKFFFPYYYVITIPSFSVLAGYLLTRSGSVSSEESKHKISRFLLMLFNYITAIFVMLSPLALTANTIHPFWDLFFTLIINIEREEPILKIVSIQSAVMITVLSIIIFLLCAFFTRASLSQN